MMFSRRFTRRVWGVNALVLGLALVIGLGAPATILAAQPGTPAATPLSEAVARLDFTVDLGDFETEAQLTYPAGQPGPFPTVLLIPGSGPADLDFTLINPATGEVISTIFRDIAEYLSARGYAVVRYNKHYVEGPDDYFGQGGQTYYQNFTFPMLLEDAQRVLAAARELPQVDPERIIAYGWSEGGIIAVQLALAEPDLAGLILHGAPDTQFVDVFRYQLRELAVSFLREFADADQDGLVSLEDIFAAYQQHPGTVGNYVFIFAFDPTSTFEDPVLNSAIDQNEDGLFDIEAEVIPYLDNFFANFEAETAAGRSPYGPQYASDQQFPAVIDVIDELTLPILLIHGENDANVPPEASDRLAAVLADANHPDHTLITYPGLGHSLGPAETVYDDFFAPIAPEPLADIVAWLDARFKDGVEATPVGGDG